MLHGGSMEVPMDVSLELRGGCVEVGLHGATWSSIRVSMVKEGLYPR